MKRSNSAPMIPEMIEAVELKPPTLNSLFSRRGLSTSNVSLPGDIVRPELSPRRQPALSLSRINSPTSRQHRVEQLKKEELIDERHNEREVQEQILLTKTCSDMKLNPEDNELKPESMDVQVSPTHQSFASPASPLARMRSRSLTPTSPSSARSFTYRRSLSPVLTIRPSSLCFGIGQKRKRDQEEDLMDTSPSSMPNKKLHISGGYASPLNLSPCVSPLTSLHQHSFIPTVSRKSSSTQSESTPLSSPSSLVQSNNPFAINYDSGNCEHWQSGHSGSASGSTCSSAGQSPPGIVVNDEHKMMMTDSGSIEISTEAPTPLSPKGLQFRQKPAFNLLSSSLPSPIPRTLTNGITAVGPQGPVVHIVSAAGVVGGVNSHTVVTGAVGTGASLRGGACRGVLKPHPLRHDTYLSPFNSDLTHAHSHAPRMIKVPTKSRHASTTSVDYHSGTRINNRLNSCSSPLAKLSMSSRLDDSAGTAPPVNHGNPPAGGIPIHQLNERQLLKRTSSEASSTADSRDETTFMDSDSEGQTVVGGMEEPVGVPHLCGGSQKPFDTTKVLHTHS